MSRTATFYDSYMPVSKRAIGPLFFVLVLFYLGFHTVSGERGVLAMFTEGRRLEILKEELATLKAQREALDSKVKLLSNASLDLDMLDERAKEVLGLAGKDEVVVFLSDGAAQQ